MSPDESPGNVQVRRFRPRHFRKALGMTPVDGPSYRGGAADFVVGASRRGLRQ